MLVHLDTKRNWLIRPRTFEAMKSWMNSFRYNDIKELAGIIEETLDTGERQSSPGYYTSIPETVDGVMTFLVQRKHRRNHPADPYLIQIGHYLSGALYKTNVSIDASSYVKCLKVSRPNR